WYTAAVMGLPIVVALLVAILMAVLLGVGSYIFLYEPFEKRQAPHLVPLIASLGLYIVLENLVGIIFGSGVRVVQEFNNGIHFMGPVFFTTIHIWQVVVLVILGGALAVFLRWSSYGKAVLAMTDNVEMARIIGIDTRKVAILVFA